MEFYNQNCCNNNMYYENKKDCDSYNRNERKNCCIKKVEEIICCYPSYYNEEQEDEKDEHFYPCYEGSFTICPRKSYCNKHKNNRHYKCDNYNKNLENRNNRCCFCRLFSRW